MTLLDFLKSQLLIEQARVKARKAFFGEKRLDWCNDDEAVIAEIERQIWELEEGI